MSVADAQFAATMIAEDGATVTWVKTNAAATNVTVDATMPWKVTEEQLNNAPVPPTQFVVKCLLTRGKGLAAQLYSLMKGSDVPGGGQMGLLPGNVPFTPELTDTVIKADATVLAISSIDVVEPDGVPVLYYITFQK